MDLLQPKSVTFTDQNGKARNFFISKFPAVQGREIMTQYPMNNIPKVSAYSLSEEVMMKLMRYVGVQSGDVILPLTTMELINNHTGDWETLAKVEWAMMEYNCSFFQGGNPFISLIERCLNFVQKIIETSTPSLDASSVPSKQPSTNSEPSTP